MTTPKTEQIICAVRGGRESRQTVTHAIDLALEHNSIRTVYQQLHEMGEFALLILCDRAERRGVSQVDCLVREGNIRKQLTRFALETHAEILVMGRPVRSPGNNVFKPAEFDAYTAELEAETGLKIITVQPKV